MPGKIIYSILFLPMIVYIGVATSVADFTSLKVKNKLILKGLVYSFVIYLVAWVLYCLVNLKIIYPSFLKSVFYLIWNFDKWFINLIVSALLAYLLWHFKLWGAGDAKLFICYSALIPMGQYSRAYFNYYFAALLLLMTTFIPATVFLLLRANIYIVRRLDSAIVKKAILKKITLVNLIGIFKVAFGFSVFFLFLHQLRMVFFSFFAKLLPYRSILIVFLLFLFRPLSKIFKKFTFFIVFIFIMLMLYSFIFEGYKLKGLFLKRISQAYIYATFLMVAFLVLKKTMDLYLTKTSNKTTPFAIWMFLGALIAWFL